MRHAAFATIVIILFAVLTSSLTSCSHDKDEPIGISVQTVSGSYKLTALTYQNGTQPEEDMMVLMPTCQKDDVITLNNTRTYVYTDAGTKCVPPGDDTGSWDLPTSTKFQLDGDDWVVEGFDGKIFKISQTDNSGGTPEVTRMTFTRQ